MKIKFWGVRGSSPVSNKDFIKYGGNTTCLEITNDSGDLIIIDGGTGIRELGKSLMSKKKKIEAALLLSHTHWDHIQGIPFFIPFYIPNNEFKIFAPIGTKRSIKEILELQMDHDYFPLNFNNLAANFDFKQIEEETFTYKNFQIQSKMLNHGGIGSSMGYRITADGKSFVFASDHEPYELFFANQSGRSTAKMINKLEAAYRTFLTGADYILHDAQYPNDEYETKRGWGHSSIDYAVSIVMSVGCQNLIMIHHDPEATDNILDKRLEEEKQKLKDEGLDFFNISFAQEGKEIII